MGTLALKADERISMVKNYLDLTSTNFTKTK